MIRDKTLQYKINSGATKNQRYHQGELININI